MTQRIIKYLCFILLIGILCMSNVQYHFNMVKEEPMGGAFVRPPEAVYSTEQWFKGDYQETFNKEFNTSFGFRNSLIRLRNQLYFSVLHASAESDFIIDNKNYIHARNNIRSVTGDDFKGAAFFNERIRKLKVVSDSLKAHGIPLLVVIAPGRANILKNQIPARYHPADSIKTNYYWLNKKIKENGIDHINYHQYFLDIKDTVKYPLFYKNGVHWSVVSFTYAFDSIVSKLASYKKTRIAHFAPNDTTVIRDSADIQDADQIPAMNLFTYKPDEKFHYPYWHVDSTVQPLPKLLCVGDSYFLTFLYQHMIDNIFDYQFWFYHNWVFPQNFTKETHLEDIDYWQTVMNADYVLIVTSEYSWDLGGFDFVENAYNYFNDKEGTVIKTNLDIVKKKVLAMNDYINRTPDYLKAEIDKAAQNKISIAEMTLKDAFYLVELDYKQKLNDEATFQTLYASYKQSKTVNNYINTMPAELKSDSDAVIRILAYMNAYKNKASGNLNIN